MGRGGATGSGGVGATWKHGETHASRVAQLGFIEVHPRSVSFKVRPTPRARSALPRSGRPPACEPSRRRTLRRVETAVADAGAGAQDVDVDTLYMLRINIKNVHDRAHRVKIVPPETSHFKLLYVPGEPLAPGLEVSAEVEFRAREVPCVAPLSFHERCRRQVATLRSPAFLRINSGGLRQTAFLANTARRAEQVVEEQRPQNMRRLLRETPRQ